MNEKNKYTVSRFFHKKIIDAELHDFLQKYYKYNFYTYIFPATWIDIVP